MFPPGGNELQTLAPLTLGMFSNLHTFVIMPHPVRIGLLNGLKRTARSKMLPLRFETNLLD